MKTLNLVLLMVTLAAPAFAAKSIKPKAQAKPNAETSAPALVPASFESGMPSGVQIKEVPLSETVKLGINGKVVELKRVASGLRYKKVAFITANVYVGQAFSNAKVDRSSLSAMQASLFKELPFVLTLTFLRDVDAKKLSDGFKETLSENGVKIDQAPYSEFLAAVGTAGEMKKGDSYVFAFGGVGGAFTFFAHGKEQFSLSSAAADVTSNFSLIWFGKAPDSGLESLQKDLLK